MSDFNKKIEVKKSVLVRIAPFIVWLMIFVIPGIVGEYLMERVEKVNDRLWLVSAKHILVAEAQKLSGEMIVENFFKEQLNMGEMEFIYSALFLSGNIAEKIRFEYEKKIRERHLKNMVQICILMLGR